ncbi:small G protein signaling modulator 1-like isoform X2 [Phalaenopsis equestris]|uniref:small G protein signaling modulator 1-like isoform X2 n=1 Tax=Phalaenopsis equestris TaxID=78828 RepID=UPI0009E2AFF1|nr:small G protein signaling modulator 1-like isoform X2 [Phalaenopsis equestris]
MLFDKAARCTCGSGGVVNLQMMSSIVKEIREPCLYHSPTRRNKMLNPEKWQAVFDGDGKLPGFRKALKLIILGGVDPSIRAEVWEFLLGCYALSSTADYRRRLRMARRERYDDLIRQCQTMHSSIGTGTLAYAVGSKVMDMRTSSKCNDSKEAMRTFGRNSQDTTDTIETYSALNNGYMDSSYQHQKQKSSNSVELYSARMSSSSAACDSASTAPPSLEYNLSEKPETELHELQCASESFYDFPSLPVTNLFEKNGTDDNRSKFYDDNLSVSKRTTRFRDERMHSFQINNNVDLIIESNDPTNGLSRANSHGTEFFSTYIKEKDRTQNENGYKNETVSKLWTLDTPGEAMEAATTSIGSVFHDEKVSEWLWILHRIVVDVVRTDSQLEFYGDSKNMARMSDILAVYAWIDPATGYCQGMSDLLSPFVVLYEDNADALWCFEMLLRRMIEGPTGVMKQLQALWKILGRTDAVLFEHLTVIGAESLHFAFRMLLVHFRRELSFTEALFMWEMMWAADFDEAILHRLEEKCLEPLLVRVSCSENGEENAHNGKRKFKRLHSRFRHETWESDSNELRSSLSHPFCGLTKANFWARHDQLQACDGEPIGNEDDELSVFCVAAILIINRQKILRETHSIDDVIKMFNDNVLKINVKRCIRMAIKLRKKYFNKLYKQMSASNFELQ